MNRTTNAIKDSVRRNKLGKCCYDREEQRYFYSTNSKWKTMLATIYLYIPYCNMIRIHANATMTHKYRTTHTRAH